MEEVSAVIASPPYADVASRNRSAEPYSQAMDPVLKRRYGSGDVNRHIDGYGTAPGQIGSLPHAVIGSPPYANRTAEVHEGVLATAERRGDLGNPSPALWGTYGHTTGQIGATEGETYSSAVLQVYRECWRVCRPGAVLVLVTGDYVRDGRIVDLAGDTIRLAVAAGWTPVERWRHRKAQVSFWRRLHHAQGRPIVAYEDVLVFCKGPAPAWAFADLPPTRVAPARLKAKGVQAMPLVLPLESEVAG